MGKNGTAPNEYMHESLKKDAVKYDLPSEEIISALANDNESPQAENERLREILAREIDDGRADVDDIGVEVWIEQALKDK